MIMIINFTLYITTMIKPIDFTNCSEELKAILISSKLKELKDYFTVHNFWSIRRLDLENITKNLNDIIDSINNL